MQWLPCCAKGGVAVQAEIIPTCRELGIGIVPYSPLGRGFLTGTVRSLKDLHETDARVLRFPRFQGDNLEKVRKACMLPVIVCWKPRRVGTDEVLCILETCGYHKSFNPYVEMICNPLDTGLVTISSE